MIDEATVRRLAAHRCAAPSVTLYLDVGGGRHPRESDYRPHLEALVREVRRHAVALGTDVAKEVERDVADIRTWLARGFDRRRTAGLAFFSCHEEAFFDVVPVPVAVRDQVVVAPAFAVAQLCGALAVLDPALVVVADRHRSRLIWFVRGEAEECHAPADDAPRQVDNTVELGSFGRRHEEQAHAHFRRVAQAVAVELRARRLGRIVLAGKPGDVAELERHLPPDVRGLVVCTTSLAVTSDLRRIEKVVSALLLTVRRDQEEALSRDLADRVEQDHGAVGGLVPTLEALATKKVSTLVVERGTTVGGGRCPQCGALTAEVVGICPQCGGTPEATTDVVDAAVGEACARHVAVEFCEPGALAALGGIGALVRSEP